MNTSLLSLGFPMSYILFGIIVILLLIIIGTILGLVSASVVFGMISIGMIRITPLIEKINEWIHLIFPDYCKKTANHIYKSFDVKGSIKSEKCIYLFHPHGAFSASYFFHSCTELTKWKSPHPYKTTISRIVLWLPFADELSEKLGVVSNVYDSMKSVLENKESLHVIPGGTSEIPFTKNGKMKLKLLERVGIFRLALETGTPLVPVLTYGENELYRLILPRLQSFLQKHFHFILPIPSLSSIIKWLGLIIEPLDIPVTTHIGEILEVKQVDSPTENDIINLRNIYIKKLKELYKITRPDYYAQELEIS